MARRLFDFECPDCGNAFEELIDDKKRTLPCLEAGCSGKAVRQIAAARLDWRKMGLDPGFPSAYEKWGNAKRQHHLIGKDTMHGGKGHNLLMY